MSSNELRIENITKIYCSGNQEQMVLNDVTYQFEKGKVTAIVGESGSGKTSLLNILGGLDTSYSGKVYSHGRLIKDYDIFRRSEISFIFQSVNLIEHHSILENVKIGLTNDIQNKDDKAIELLNLVGLGEHLTKKPYQLSGGEKKRVAIARALARDSNILICDEPTRNLDHKTKNEIMDLIISVFRDKTIIFTSHDKNIVDGYSDVILTIENQVIKEICSKPIEKHQIKYNKGVHQKSFDRRFIKNLLSNKSMIFSYTYLYIVVSAILLFCLGMINGTEREFDKYLYDTYKVDNLTLTSNGLTFNGIRNNIDEFNSIYDNPILGFSTGLYVQSRLSESKTDHLIYFNSLNDGIKKMVEEDIVYGRYPLSNNEILVSRGAAIEFILIKNNYMQLDDIELAVLLDKIHNLDDSEIFYEITTMNIDYKNYSKYSNELVYDNEFKIVGVIDDFRYFSDLKLSSRHHLIAMKYNMNFNANRDLQFYIDGKKNTITVNSNIYVYEDEMMRYIDKMYYGNNGYKFLIFNMFVNECNLELREEVFDDFISFKSIFRGDDYISAERKLYFSDVRGYKVAISGGSIILLLFSLVSIGNGITTMMSKQYSNIAVYISLGYSKKNIKSMYIREGIIISAFVTMMSLFLWFCLNTVMNKKFLEALDPSKVLNLNNIIYLDSLILVFIASTIFIIIYIFIVLTLHKISVVELFNKD